MRVKSQGSRPHPTAPACVLPGYEKRSIVAGSARNTRIACPCHRMTLSSLYTISLNDNFATLSVILSVAFVIATAIIVSPSSAKDEAVRWGHSGIAWVMFLLAGTLPVFGFSANCLKKPISFKRFAHLKLCISGHPSGTCPQYGRPPVPNRHLQIPGSIPEQRGSALQPQEKYQERAWAGHHHRRSLQLERNF